MLAQLGTNLPTTQSLQLKNVAAVMVTASLPPFARVGQQIDVTVSSMGNAKSLRGGTLVMTPLKGADGQIYAQAQGNLLVGGAGALPPAAARPWSTIFWQDALLAARPSSAKCRCLGQGPYVHYEWQTDFGTDAARGRGDQPRNGAGTAQALDGRLIRVVAPEGRMRGSLSWARVENLEVRPTKTVAKVIINPRTGSVVMNQAVTIESCAVAHGALSVVVNTEQQVSQPNALAGGQTVTNADRHPDQAGWRCVDECEGRAPISSDVVKAINALGANPQDLLSILQAMKAAGALARRA
jgi:flagellar P-ring protein precursor FlgI